MNLKQNQRTMRISLLAVALIVLAAGCHLTPQTAPPSNSKQQAAPDNSTTQQSHSKTPITDALVSLLEDDAAGDHVYPKGVKLNSEKLHNGVATLDFSQEFSALANSGESVESAAQKALQATLARYDKVEKMRVTVEGKRFESQATDWYTPFAVRDSASEGDRTAERTDGAGKGAGERIDR